MVNMDELHQELMISQKIGELTIKANNLLEDYTNEIMDTIYKNLHSKLEKNELLKGGREFVFKHWKNFNSVKFENPGPYFKEIFKRGLAISMRNNSKEYKEAIFLESLNSMGRKILRFNLPYEIELDGSIIRKFSFVDNPDAHDPSIKPNYEQNS